MQDLRGDGRMILRHLGNNIMEWGDVLFHQPYYLMKI